MTQNSNLLKSGIDYPKNWDQFIDWFHDDQACLDYISKIRWPNGFICPRCHVNKTPYKLKNGTLKCAAFRKETSVTSGTIFNKTRTSLKDWFGAVWYIRNQKNGVSALGVYRLLGLGSYQTSWALLHKLRSAMLNPEREKLSGALKLTKLSLVVLCRGKAGLIKFHPFRVTKPIAPLQFSECWIRLINSQFGLPVTRLKSVAELTRWEAKQCQPVGHLFSRQQFVG